jgi:hypothetical protein
VTTSDSTAVGMRCIAMLEIPSNKELIVNQLNQLLKRSRKRNVIADFSKVANSSLTTGYFENRRVNRVIFYLRSKGCQWACTDFGGCYMCGHYYGTSMGVELPDDSYYKQFKREYEKYDFSNIPILCIYNAGSILNPWEISNGQLYKILKLISENRFIKCVILESRPEFINYEILHEISEILKNKVVEIGIGLETSNDNIRTLCINKGFTFSQYNHAANLIKKFANLRILTYLNVKPLFLTTQESIDDIVTSIRDISTLTDSISLEPTSIQKNTMVEFMYNAGTYDVPKGWVIRDILNEVMQYDFYPKLDLRIGGFEFFPTPDIFIRNCDKCNKSLYDAIESYNTTKKIAKIQGLTCDCYTSYKLEKIRENDLIGRTELKDRILDIVTKAILLNPKEKNSKEVLL